MLQTFWPWRECGCQWRRSYLEWQLKCVWKHHKKASGSHLTDLSVKKRCCFYTDAVFLCQRKNALLILNDEWWKTPVSLSAREELSQLSQKCEWKGGKMVCHRDSRANSMKMLFVVFFFSSAGITQSDWWLSVIYHLLWGAAYFK